MNDQTTTFEQVKEIVLQFNRERNWVEHQNPKDLAASICIEAAELMELFQWGSYSRRDVEADALCSQNLREELADVLIYSLCMANAMGLDLTTCITEKLKKNALRYPVPEK